MDHRQADQRKIYSIEKMELLKSRIASLSEAQQIPGLTIFAAGSYGRSEASEHSDLDLFLVRKSNDQKWSESRTQKLRLFGRLIELADELKFPKFSNDCEYLEVIELDDIRRHLGGRVDDHANYFTVRMLLLLESTCLYGHQIYEETIAEAIQSYFPDFEAHKESFEARFLMNDIHRYWMTLLVNYENNRATYQEFFATAEEHRLWNKVKNFKLKFARLTMCYATLIGLGTIEVPVTPDCVRRIVRMTPCGRLADFAKRCPEFSEAVERLIEKYDWYLEMTGLPKATLEARIGDSKTGPQMAAKADEYADAMYNLISQIDSSLPALRLQRFLVI